MDSSPRSRVALVEFDGTPAIVKRIAGGPDAEARYARELAALGLAARADPPVVPRVLGTDPQNTVMVLEYLESRPPAADWVVDYARTLARLHAVGRVQDTGLLPRFRGPGERDVSAFLHGDPCPGNDLHTAGGVRLVDLEQASFGDGLIELAFLRIGFPTCWCVTDTPPVLRDEAEAANVCIGTAPISWPGRATRLELGNHHRPRPSSVPHRGRRSPRRWRYRVH